MRDRILSAARAQIGRIAYVQYGDPSELQDPAQGLNCYGFINFILSSAGIYVPRGLFELWDELDSVSKPIDADLIFFDSRRRVRPGHVGFYAARGSVVHCAKEHGGVVETPLDYGKVMGYRRLPE